MATKFTRLGRFNLSEFGLKRLSGSIRVLPLRVLRSHVSAEQSGFRMGAASVAIADCSRRWSFRLTVKPEGCTGQLLSERLQRLASVE